MVNIVIIAISFHILGTTKMAHTLTAMRVLTVPSKSKPNWLRVR